MGGRGQPAGLDRSGGVQGYVLPIIFLRFLSVRYEQRRDLLASEVREPASPYYAATEAERRVVLEDEDSYRSAGVFPIPEEARWETIRRHAQADDIKISDQAIHGAWHQTAEALHSRALKSLRASNTLAELRNVLLPKLLTGDIRVAEAEEQAEAAVA